MNAFCELTSDFTQPLLNAALYCDVDHGLWAKDGQIIYIEGGGYYEVTASSATTISWILRAAEAIPGANVSGPGVTPGAFPGPTGATGATGPAGATGASGAAGATGATGSTGATGAAGEDGADGLQAVVYAYGAGTTEWTRPASHKMMSILCVGSGGAGGAGYAAAGGVNKGGGAGGGGGGSMRWVGPAAWESLWAVVGAGGTDVPGNAGNNGNLSYVTTENGQSAFAYLVCKSGTTSARGGGKGTSTTVGTVQGETLSTGGALSGYGTWTAIIGVTSGGGGYSAAPSGLTALNSATVGTGGTGGGGATAANAMCAGAAITGAGAIPTVAGGVAGVGASPGGPGGAGYDADLDFGVPQTCGGTGGGGSAYAAGGAGGDGGVGSGGGGGGGGVTGGNGGHGGDGIIVITSW